MGEWRDISTAPKDGSDIILGSFLEVAGAKHFESIMVGKWKDGRFQVVIALGYGEFIFSSSVQLPWTHWVPLPAPPSPEKHTGE